MTNPIELVQNTAEFLANIADLVFLLNGDPSNVKIYTDSFPFETRLLDAILSASRPSVLIAYGGMIPGMFGLNEVDKHRMLAYFRSGQQTDPTASDLFAMHTAVMAANFRYTTIHENCFPPESITFKRVMHLSEKIADYWEFSFLLTEINAGNELDD
jgi:hypothetical protein